MFELLGDSGYQHILLNHLPVSGLAIAVLVLAAGLVLRQDMIVRTGLVLVALMAGVSAFVGLTGDNAYPATYDALDGDGRRWLDYHAYLADKWLPLLYANSALAAAVFILGIVRRQLLFPAAVLVMLVTFVGLGFAGQIAEAGGKIKHPEFRLQDPPIYESPRRLRTFQGRRG